MQLDHANILDLTVQDLVAKRVAVLGASGSGKTNTVARLVENILPSIPCAIIDPHEDYYGLRQKFGGLLIAGRGLHTDIDLTVDNAANLAEYSITNRLSVILDMLLMDEDERAEVVFAFCESLWRQAIKAEVRMPYTVVIDEAHNFIPEGGRQTPMSKRMRQFANEGRKFGIGMILSTQRAAAVSKAVLANCEMYFLHGVSIQQDVDAYASVLPYKPDETRKIVYALDTGEVLFRQGRRVEQVKILRRETFHAGDTPTLDNAPAPQLQMIDATLLDSLRTVLKSSPGSLVPSATADPALRDQLDHQVHEIQRLTTLAEERAAIIQAQAQEIERLNRQLHMTIQGDTVLREANPLFPAAVLEATEATLVRETTITTERTVEHLSSRQLSMQIKQEERQRDQLVGQLRSLERAHRRIVRELMAEDDKRFTVAVLARRLDYAEDTVRKAGNALHRMGLISRPAPGVFAGAFARYIIEQFKHLQATDVFDRMSNAVRN